MQVRYRRIDSWLCFLLFTCFAIGSLAQTPTAEVKKKVYLRSGPSMTDQKKTLLQPSDVLQILEPQPTSDFYHVQTEDGDEGWVAARNINIKQQPPELAPPGEGTPSGSISATWEKPEPKRSTLNGTKKCPWNGDDSDPGTFLFKNRADTPQSYHDVTWDAIATMEYPSDKPLRKNWTPEHVAQLKAYEGIPVRAVGYLVAYKPQAHGSGEGTNCHMNKPSETDTHMALVKEAGDAEKTSIVIEFTPRFLKAHPNWNRKALSRWINGDDPVRISGWLMLDPDHRNHLSRFRSTLWEIHPITLIEVWQDNTWVNLDTGK